MFLVKCLSSCAGVLKPHHYPTKKETLWSVDYPTNCSLSHWLYYLNIQEYLPQAESGVPLAMELFISSPVLIKFDKHRKEKAAIYLYTASVCVSVRQTKREGGRTVWISVLACIMYVPCNLTPINLTDGLVIITKCRCDKLELGSLWLPVIWWVRFWLKRWWSHFDILILHHNNW